MPANPIPVPRPRLVGTAGPSVPAPAPLCPTLTTDADAEAKVGRVVRASPGGQEAGFPGKEQRGGEAFGVLVTTSVLS